MVKKIIHITFILTVVFSHGLTVIDHYKADSLSILDIEHSEKSEIEIDDVEEENIDFIERGTMVYNFMDSGFIVKQDTQCLLVPLIPHYDLHDPPPEV